ncbi:class I SAM-dependent methyltransferase [Caballeronia sp. INSB1]|uniref:class I SAM-dependent methyltransferase n=1 Tax=Caballeronia sp. INSB1 TaxID=2921751 RepID=UPI002032BDB0|nr:class I SAM-dependent methyltransferase [Caballeronia sp. INSB1]
MKIACFVMMRNEAPILGPFLDQIEALFDQCVILNHGSSDDSVKMVGRRDSSKFELYQLKASGYPQSEVATFFAKNAFSQDEADYLFFLDCDEFLPFDDRKHLEEFLSKKSGADVIRLPWLNACPENFDGGNIFSSTFIRGLPSPLYFKVALKKSIAAKAPDFIVSQGYHDVSTAGDRGLIKVDCDDSYCIHIPIQSRVQFGFKLANGNNRLMRERINIAKRNGFHWVDLAKQFATGGLDSKALRNLALNYPDQHNVSDRAQFKLDFKFPYVKSEYSETQNYVSSQIAGLVDFEVGESESPRQQSFSVVDVKGNVVLTGGSQVAASRTSGSTLPARLGSTDLFEGFASEFSKLIEPLFSVPTKLPVTAWQGHIPFMFALMKLLKPKTYVELGVHNGASLIAACTAAKSYNLDCRLYGVDAWMGDDHAGHYEGEAIYTELKTHLDVNFRNVKLVRSFFADARSQFRDESIDLLHIDGLHTYDAVKEDFTTWFSAMTPSGVILFHDTCVYDRGFGVHRLWEELKERFATVEFHHSYGLGVLFLDPHDPRLGPLMALASDKTRMGFYQDLVSLIAGTLPERMGYFSAAGIVADKDRHIADRDRHIADKDRHIADLNQKLSELTEVNRRLQELQTEVQALRGSTSWRITAPLRALKGHHG